jgi:CheY-like chemotaxis protein
VESEINKGTVFTVKFPLVEKETVSTILRNEIAQKQVKSDIKRTNILCVDDDIITQDFLYSIFKSTHNIEFANNGVSAVNMVKSTHYSIIIMDINLGKGLNGIETTNLIRGIPGYSKIPIIAMTAFAMTGDKEEFLEAGLDAYISKPFDVNSIKKLIETLLKEKH